MPQDPDSFTCYLCGDHKPLDDLEQAARKEYSEPVCYRCWLIHSTLAFPPSKIRDKKIA